MSFEKTFDGVDKVISNLHNENMKHTISEIIRYGRHLDKLRSQGEEVISSGDVLKTLIEHGMQPSLALQIKEAIDNPNAEITFK